MECTKYNFTKQLQQIQTQIQIQTQQLYMHMPFSNTVEQCEAMPANWQSTVMPLNKVGNT